MGRAMAQAMRAPVPKTEPATGRRREGKILRFLGGGAVSAVSPLLTLSMLSLTLLFPLAARGQEKDTLIGESGIHYPGGFDPNTVGEVRGKRMGTFSRRAGLSGSTWIREKKDTRSSPLPSGTGKITGLPSPTAQKSGCRGPSLSARTGTCTSSPRKSASSLLEKPWSSAMKKNAAVERAEDGSRRATGRFRFSPARNGRRRSRRRGEGKTVKKIEPQRTQRNLKLSKGRHRQNKILPIGKPEERIPPCRDSFHGSRLTAIVRSRSKRDSRRRLSRAAHHEGKRQIKTDHMARKKYLRYLLYYYSVDSVNFVKKFRIGKPASEIPPTPRSCEKIRRGMERGPMSRGRKKFACQKRH